MKQLTEVVITAVDSLLVLRAMQQECNIKRAK
jgi:hypothetical protein